MPPTKRSANRRRIVWWVAVIALTLVMLGVSIWLMGPSPPRMIRLATGQEGGGYDTFGKEYQARLEKMGLEVELVHTQVGPVRAPI